MVRLNLFLLISCFQGRRTKRAIYLSAKVDGFCTWKRKFPLLNYCSLWLYLSLSLSLSLLYLCFNFCCNQSCHMSPSCYHCSNPTIIHWYCYCYCWLILYKKKSTFEWNKVIFSLYIHLPLCWVCFVMSKRSYQIVVFLSFALLFMSAFSTLSFTSSVHTFLCLIEILSKLKTFCISWRFFFIFRKLVRKRCVANVVSNSVML